MRDVWRDDFGDRLAWAAGLRLTFGVNLEVTRRGLPNRFDAVVHRFFFRSTSL